MADGTVLVIDASALVDLLLGTERAGSIRNAVRGRRLAAPAHVDVEVMSALARLERGGELSDHDVTVRIERLADAPIDRAPLPPLVVGAWARRTTTRITDSLYVELAHELDTVVVTTDERLARAHPDRTHVPVGQ